MTMSAPLRRRTSAGNGFTTQPSTSWRSSNGTTGKIVGIAEVASSAMARSPLSKTNSRCRARSAVTIRVARPGPRTSCRPSAPPAACASSRHEAGSPRGGCRSASGGSSGARARRARAGARCSSRARRASPRSPPCWCPPACRRADPPARSCGWPPNVRQPFRSAGPEHQTHPPAERPCARAAATGWSGSPAWTGMRSTGDDMSAAASTITPGSPRTCALRA